MSHLTVVTPQSTTILPRTLMGGTVLPESRLQAKCRAVWRNSLEQTGIRFSIPRNMAPNTEERQALHRRSRELGEACAACGDVEAVAARLARFLPKFAASGKDPAGTMAAYAKDLVNFPLWAIEAACMQFVAEGKREFAPSSPVMVGMIRALLMPLQAERHDLDKIMTAIVYDPPSAEQRAATAKRIAQIAKDACNKLEKEQRPIDDRSEPPASQWSKGFADDRLERLRQTAQEPIVLSDAARAVVGLPPREPDHQSQAA